MKIAILTDLPYLNNKTMYLDNLQKSLGILGIEVEVFVVQSPSYIQMVESRSGMVRIIKSLAMVQRLRQFDIIHVQFTFPIGTAMALLSRIKILTKPIIIHTHGYDVFTVPSINYGFRRNKIWAKIASSTWNESERVIVVCNKAREELQKVIVDPNKIELLYNGVDEAFFDQRGHSEIPNPIKFVRDENDILFLSIASMAPVKNHVSLVESFLELVTKYKSKYRIKLLLIGTEYYGSNVKLRKSDSIMYLGKQDHANLPYYYSSVDAFFLPSLSEAHPWSLLEAMSCRLPVVGANVGGIPETIQDSQFIVDPLNIKSIFDKMCELVEMDPSERTRLGQLNREKILRSFTFKHHVDNLMRIYDRISI